MRLGRAQDPANQSTLLGLALSWPHGLPLGWTCVSSCSGTMPVPWHGTVGGGPEKIRREVQLWRNMLVKGAEHAGNSGSTSSDE